jgi:hypothetical protein
MRKRYRERFESSTIFIMITMKEEEETKGRNAVMTECCLELFFRSEYVAC